MSKKSLQNWKGTTAVIGVDWGDSGKGRLIDDLASGADIIARFNGGSNTGHTVKNGFGEFALHIMPSGIFHQSAICITGKNVAIDLESLFSEMANLDKAGISYKNLRIDEQASLTMPWHKKRDGQRENKRNDKKIGTTGKGVGPTYADRTERVGLLVKDLFAPDFKQKFTEEFDYQVHTYQIEGLHKNQLLEEYRQYAKKLKRYVGKTYSIVKEAQEEGKNILFEGAQGFFLDIDFGTYPFVTSSHPGVVGIWTSFGINPTQLDEIIGITKAYTTRVGEGPMPSQIKGKASQEIVKRGKEVGTTTGRIRRPGWLDLVLIKDAAHQNMLTGLAITKLDVFSGIPNLKLCTGYRYKGKSVYYYPHDAEMLSKCTPIYEELPGWKEDISNVRKFDDLPSNAKKYIRRIEEITGVPVKFVSVGPERGQVIYV